MAGVYRQRTGKESALCRERVPLSLQLSTALYDRKYLGCVDHLKGLEETILETTQR